ncbi:MAG: hypothetical protein Q7U68_02910, partial [Candidatus Roizmanbacteria bacterium]|nr:hypothetical protein [Candidatus Roizmanbacteria bacterium]
LKYFKLYLYYGRGEDNLNSFEQRGLYSYELFTYWQRPSRIGMGRDKFLLYFLLFSNIFKSW